VAFAPPAFDNRRMGRFERRWRAASRRHWAILGVCVFLLLAGTWLAVGERAMPRVVVLPEPVRPLRTEVAVEAATTPSPPRRAASDARRSDRVEVCGIGEMEAGTPAGIDPSVLERMPAVRASRGRLVESLRASSDDFERAAALWLDMVDAILAARALPEADPACQGESCAPAQRVESTFAPLRDRLAHVATTTSDPRAYALAFTTCRKSPQEGSCALLNAGRWSQLDPGNGEPWMQLLHEAVARKDAAQVDEALFRIGAAERLDSRDFAVPGLIARHAGAGDVDVLAAYLLEIDAVGVVAAQANPTLQSVLNACRAPLLADANRRLRCEGAATALAERADTVTQASIGVRLGRRLGWDSARADAVLALSPALGESARGVEPDPQSWSCGRARRMLDRMMRLDAVGETRFARDWIAASGSTVDRYAAQERERRRRPAEAGRGASAGPTAGGGAEAVSASADAGNSAAVGRR
jgi:hypothetical protein